MRTFLRTCIIVISLAIITIFTADYNTTLSTRLCQKINFCTTTKDKVISTPPQIIYTTGTKIYDEIRFYQDNEQDMSRFEELKEQGYTCGLGEGGGGYGIGGGALGCEQVPGYYHQYDIPEWGMKIIAFDNVLPYFSDNYMIKASIDFPFIISGNSILEKGSSSSFMIEYMEHSQDDIPLILIDRLPESFMYDGLEFHKSNDEFISNGAYYRPIHTETGRLVSKEIFYHANKNYYYIKSIFADGCAPGPCGIGQHSIEYFRK
ncbi:hypothetical protein XF24_00933 [candidate division SR1 bacterium Aalborg_AAW-1]|nr:hypothetical protein XF24_00933 [candidate division SR1 bacterium Aalborg_AAW-1]